MIEIKNITQSYGKNKILDDVSLLIKGQAITALIGANGAGKSTLLGVITRLIPALSGEVLLNGMSLKKMNTKEIAKKIAILKQTQSLNIRISVNDLVEFGRFPHCAGRLRDIDKEKVNEAIDYMDLDDIRYKYLDELSGGQKQRAFIAMILAQDTPYIFLDEPLNNLDIKYSVEMMKIIRSLVQDLNKTVVIVLHDINFAAAYSDYIVAMKDGKINHYGRVEDMIDKRVLDNIFDHDFHIAEHNGKKVCLYYDSPHFHNGNKMNGKSGRYKHSSYSRKALKFNNQGCKSSFQIEKIK